ncbi:hypothetical protein CEXT_267861 [Caerostris extrusa]|uniref:Uncharacterized protein n=1 Tax=Caerostris extrusa TaxID=172846 RepID=A0AAV4TRJ9_CAEEX|nr:hypothetical protein CEXT_267861 [Caerostris extrusa]
MRHSTIPCQQIFHLRAEIQAPRKQGEIKGLPQRDINDWGAQTGGGRPILLISGRVIERDDEKAAPSLLMIGVNLTLSSSATGLNVPPRNISSWDQSGVFV